MAALRGCNNTKSPGCVLLVSYLYRPLARIPNASPESRAPGAVPPKRTARRVFGGAHPTTEMIELQLRYARAALRARETPSSPSPPSRSA